MFNVIVDTYLNIEKRAFNRLAVTERRALRELVFDVITWAGCSAISFTGKRKKHIIMLAPAN